MQSKKNVWNNKKLIALLAKGGVAVMPTDTIYGIVGRAQNESVVNRIYEIRKRDLHKPCIILIGDIGELDKFSVVLSEKQKKIIENYWPAFAKASAGKPVPTSIILDCENENLSYLHRGTKTLAFRLPAQAGLRKLLKETGPLIAPSANTEKFPASENMADAKKYFGNKVDLYMDGGLITGKASKVIKLQRDGSVSIIRE